MQITHNVSYLTVVALIAVSALLGISALGTSTYGAYFLMNAPYNYDYTSYAYRRLWPPAECLQHNCSKSTMGNFAGSNFGVHGLWPQGNSTNMCARPE